MKIAAWKKKGWFTGYWTLLSVCQSEDSDHATVESSFQVTLAFMSSGVALKPNPKAKCYWLITCITVSKVT